MTIRGLFYGSDKGSAGAQAKRVPIPRRPATGDGRRLTMLSQLEASGLAWFWATDAQGKISYLSEALIRHLKLEERAYQGRALTDLFAVQDPNGGTPSLALKLAARKRLSDLAVRAQRGESGAVLALSGAPHFDEEGRFCGFNGMAGEITDQTRREEETERLAKYDALTGLANRSQMTHLIESTLTAFRAAKRNCAIMMLDLDRFKQVNDTLGHAAGDELLVEVASRLERVAGSGVQIGRLGGDEFQVVIPDLDDRGQLGEIAKKIIAMLSQPYSLRDGRCVIGASAGIAIAPHDGVTLDEIVRSADMALYAAKNSGRGQFRFYSGDLAHEALFRRRLEDDLTQALRDGQIQMQYQPLIEMETGVVTGLEARPCWLHPERGLIDAEDFEALRKGSTLDSELGAWSIAKACEDALNWDGELIVSIKISREHFGSDEFLAQVTGALEQHKFDPAKLQLEINESVFGGDTVLVDNRLQALFKAGVRLVLDEYGSGHFLLGYLRRAPFSAIKLEREFRDEAAPSDTCADISLIGVLVALAQALNMSVIATGIETMDRFNALRECGVTTAQGPVFSDSLSCAQVEERLAQNNWKINPASSRSHRPRRRTVFRKIQLFHGDHSYQVTLRNISKTGALIEGLLDVPMGTQFVLDLGEGQLAVATVNRTAGDAQGLEFETPLVEDGAGGLCTRNRVSPHTLSSARAPLKGLGLEKGKGQQASQSAPQFAYSSGAHDK